MWTFITTATPESEWVALHLGLDVLGHLDLQRLVDREHEARALNGRHHVACPGGELDSARRLGDDLAAGSPGEGVVHLVFERRVTLTGGVHAADQRLEEGAVGEDPLGVRLEGDPREAELSDRGLGARRDLLGEHHVAAPPAEQRGQALPPEAQERRERRRLRLRGGDLEVVGDHVGTRDRHGEQVAAAVIDRAASGREGDLLVHLAGGVGGVAGAVEDLDDNEPHGEHEHRRAHPEDDHPMAVAGRCPRCSPATARSRAHRSPAASATVSPGFTGGR